MNFFDQVYQLTRTIPTGKVTTYGHIAKALGTKDLPADAAHQALQAGARNARTVGWALHANKDLNTPCHRVVTKDGRLAPGYAFGGSLEQYAKLTEEGVTFLDREHVDLEHNLYEFN